MPRGMRILEKCQFAILLWNEFYTALFRKRVGENSKHVSFLTEGLAFCQVKKIVVNNDMQNRERNDCSWWNWS